MTRLVDAVPWKYLVAATAVLLLGVGVALVGAWQLLVALAGGTTLLALLETALPYLLALAVLALVEIGLVVAALAKVARAVSLDDLEGDRLRAAVERVQRRLST